MKKSIRKIFALVLTFVIIFSISVVPVSAKNIYEKNNFMGLIEVYDYGNEEDKTFFEKIKDTFHWYIARIFIYFETDCPICGEHFLPPEISATVDYYNNAINSLKAYEGVVKIEKAAFRNRIGLVEINLPKSVKEIGEGAFNGCSNIMTITVDPLNEVYYSQDDCLLVKENNLLLLGCQESIISEGVEVIGTGAFANCSSLTEIKLPNTIEYIAPTAFYYNINMTKFTDVYGADTCDINDYIKLDNGVLYTVTANNKLTLSAYPTNKDSSNYEVLFNTVRIDEYAAYFNKNLKQLILPDTLEYIGNNSFYGCTKLETVEFKSVKAPVLEGTVNDLGIEYELLEGVSIRAEKQYTSDIIFIMLMDANYNTDTHFIDYLFGATTMENRIEEYEESIREIVKAYEKRNNITKRIIEEE